MAETVQQEENVEVQVEQPEDQTSEAEVQVEQTSDDSNEVEVASSGEDSSQESKDAEIESYRKGVQKRIDTLTFKVREAERREKAAVDYAKGLQESLNKNKTKLSQQQKNLYDEYSARVSSDLKVAEDNYKKAYDLGDTDALLQAQKDVARLSVEAESLKRVKPPAEQVEQEVKPVEQPSAEQPNVAAKPEPDPKAQEWARNNSWFGQDLAMTTSAFAFHEQMTGTEGYDPTSDEYYQELDKRLRESFPHKYEESVSQNNVQDNVAVSSKGTRGKKSGRTVKLTPSQVAIAKRLGVPLEEYAKHVKV